MGPSQNKFAPIDAVALDQKAEVMTLNEALQRASKAKQSDLIEPNSISTKTEALFRTMFRRPVP
ncbi:hypothetical protein [Cognatiyoonia sp. IB215182]|uniref:hypothetical protein n=1 Tax=Cognatiyoonia sp. IB215182 TaxID=3097353 RepID=UPI002A0B9447|nr:hypothetical protein [Cognatiyoonia sp. IB215182]MDX8354422.1 hypothetical protein [Cognatiyoonia sp. IB215182]